MKKIFLHIGTFKTGSTSLQFHMHKNRKALLKNGFYYGDYFDNYYLHSNLCYGLLREALTACGIFDQYKDHPRFLNVAEDPEEVIGRIKENAGDSPNIIISSEAFFSDAFRTLAGLRNRPSDKMMEDVNRYMRKRLKELLFRISDCISVVCYLRRQDLFIEAQYNQYYKNIWYGDQNEKLPEFMEFVQCRPIELNYFSVLEEWKDVFEGADFIIKPYEKKAFAMDLITDFYTEVLKVTSDEAEKFADIDRSQSNFRLDRDVLEYKKLVGITTPKVNQLLIQYSAQLKEMKDYAYFNKTERIAFMERFREQNRKVAEKYLNRSDGYLFADTNYDIPLYEGLGTDTMLEITRWMIHELSGGVS